MSIKLTVIKPLTLEDTIPFGKYRGVDVVDIVNDDPDYIEWVINNTEYEFDEEVMQLI